jgi:hypothetical protein
MAANGRCKGETAMMRTAFNRIRRGERAGGLTAVAPYAAACEGGGV